MKNGGKVTTLRSWKSGFITQKGELKKRDVNLGKETIWTTELPGYSMKISFLFLRVQLCIVQNTLTNQS